MEKRIEAIDMLIIGACNDLMEMKRKTIKEKVDNKNERARLSRELEHSKTELDNRLRSLRLNTRDFGAYREACDKVFDEAGINVPGLAAARQAQLCFHVHLITILENQQELLRDQLAKEVAAMEAELHKVRESIVKKEVDLLNEIVRLNQENREFREWMDRPIYQKKKKNKLLVQDENANDSPNSANSATIDTTNSSSLRHSLPARTRRVSFGVEPKTALMRQSSAPKLERIGKNELGNVKMIVPARPRYLVPTSQ